MLPAGCRSGAVGHDSSSLEDYFENERRARVVCEDVGRELDMAEGNGNERATLDVEVGVIGLRVLRGEPELQPIDQRIGKLGPGIEETARPFSQVKDVLACVGELQPPVQRHFIAGRNAWDVSEGATNHRRRLERQSLTDAEVVTEPERTRAALFVVVTPLEMQPAVIGYQR